MSFAERGAAVTGAGVASFAVLIAMPATRVEYFSAAESRTPSDYIRHTLRGQTPGQVWDLRYRRIVDAAEAFVGRMNELAVPCIRRATLLDFDWACRNADTVVVFAHWVHEDGCDPLTGRPAGRLELCDGLHEPTAIERVLSAQFTGSLDWCTCCSVTLAAHMKARRGDRLRTLYTQQPLDPLPAYVVVRELIALTLRNGTDYRLNRLQAAAEMSQPAFWE